MFVHIMSLVYVLAVVAVTFVAWTAMISKSGLAKWWVLAPALPVATTAVTLLIKWSQTSAFLNGGAFSFSRYGFMGWVDVIGLSAGLVLFLAFAFVPWPGVGGTRTPRASAPASRAGAVGDRGAAPMHLARFAPKGGGPVAAPGAPVDTRRRLYCPWCGEHIPGNRALGHDCGPKDRPEVICRFCGQAFPEGTTSCPRCDA